MDVGVIVRVAGLLIKRPQNNFNSKRTAAARVMKDPAGPQHLETHPDKSTGNKGTFGCLKRLI